MHAADPKLYSHFPLNYGAPQMPRPIVLPVPLAAQTPPPANLSTPPNYSIKTLTGWTPGIEKYLDQIIRLRKSNTLPLDGEPSETDKKDGYISRLEADEGISSYHLTKFLKEGLPELFPAQPFINVAINDQNNQVIGYRFAPLFIPKNISDQLQKATSSMLPWVNYYNKISKVALDFAKQLKLDRVWSCTEACMDQAFRGLGIMTKLVALEDKFLQEQAADALAVMHDVDNERAAKFQNKRGFKPIGTVSCNGRDYKVLAQHLK